MLEEAVRYTLAGENFAEAARLIERVAGKMLRQGSSSSLVRWLDAVPGEIVRANPRLCLARGWACLWGPAFRLDRAEEWAQLALEAMGTVRDPAPDLEGEVYALKALIAADRVEPALSRELSYRALERLPAGSPWLGVTTFCLGSALFAAGEYAAAAPILADALQLNQADGAVYTQLIAASFLADILVSQGHLGRAKEMYQQVLAWADSGIPQKGALVAHAGLANVLSEQNQLDSALAQVQSGIEQLEQVGGPGATLWLYRTLARVLQAQGNWRGALEAVDLAYLSGQSAQISFVMAQAAASRARLLLAQGDLEAASAWAADSGLDLNDPEASHPGLREIEYLTFARVLAAQGRQAEALSLLDQLFMSAELEERAGSAIQILALQSNILQIQGEATGALECLERALTLAEPEGYIRSFVDEGEPVRTLLFECQAKINRKIGEGDGGQSLRLLAYTDQLLAAFPPSGEARKPGNETLPEPLSGRELDILSLIAAGQSNQEIAESLTIAVSTVKTHINHLYGKLGANRRTQAITMARDLGLL
jgi:LuxR family maltose regulon positive regulatory protein